MKYDALGERMKGYENVTRNHLMRRCPVIIRIDGKAFHTFTRGFKKPFDSILVETMQDTMKYLCENIQGCVLGYTQSDEISLVLVDYKNLQSCAWFDDNIQKMVSVAASMATMAFNKFFYRRVSQYKDSIREYLDENGTFRKYSDEDPSSLDVYDKAIEDGATFDARVFNIPKEEVCNNILWRQNDATRNSIESVGQAYFSHKQLHGKSCNEIQDMLMKEKGLNWNTIPEHLKRGSCCIRLTDQETGRSEWFVDKCPPIFKGNGRQYIDSLIFVGE